MIIQIIKPQNSRRRIVFLAFLVISSIIIYNSINGFVPEKIAIVSIMILFFGMIVYFNLRANFLRIGSIKITDSSITIIHRNIEQHYSWDEIDRIRLKYIGYKGELKSYLLVDLFVYNGANDIEIITKNRKVLELPILIESKGQDRIIKKAFKDLSIKHVGKVEMIRDSDA